MIISYKDDGNLTCPAIPAGEVFVVLGVVGGLTYAHTTLVVLGSQLVTPDAALAAALAAQVSLGDAVGIARLWALYGLDLVTLDDIRAAIWNEKKVKIQDEVFKSADVKGQLNLLRKTVGLLCKGLRPVLEANLNAGDIECLDSLQAQSVALDEMILVEAVKAKAGIFGADEAELRKLS